MRRIMQTLTRNGWLAAGLVAVTVAGCAPLRVNALQWPGADFGRYRTFTWGSEDRLSTGDPRLDNNEIFRARVQRAVERELQPRGWERATGAAADVVLHVHAHIDQQIEANTIDRDRRDLTACEHGGCGPRVYEAGTLLLDFVDARTQRVAWRGWAEGSLDAVIDDQARLEQMIDEAVAKILARLPLGAEASAKAAR
jgi:hypothetical protein